jgi:hypothetical protein
VREAPGSIPGQAHSFFTFSSDNSFTIKIIDTNFVLKNVKKEQSLFLIKKIFLFTVFIKQDNGRRLKIKKY